MSFEITKAGRKLAYQQFSYPGGEIGVRINANDLGYLRDATPANHTIVARIHSPADQVALALLMNAIREHDVHNRGFDLALPYLPYARQDRVCAPGDSLSIKVFADFVNNLGCFRVWTFDPHSNVAKPLIKNSFVFNQLCLIAKNLEFVKRINNGEKVVLVAPDDGAQKKTEEVARYLSLAAPIATGKKVRDQVTGKILSTELSGNVEGATAVMIDDICDGGRTFTELGKVLRVRGAKKVVLYVTHGIFSKGLEELLTRFGGQIDEIWTTDTFRPITDIPVADFPELNVFQVPYIKMIEDRTI